MSKIKHLPAKRDVEPEIIDPEIVGFEPSLPWWRRLLARVAVGAFFAGVGAVVTLIGIVLTLTIVGAFIGIPLIIIGLVILLGALLLPMTRGRVKVVSFRWPPR